MGVACNVMGVIFSLTMLLAVVMFLLSAFSFMVSGGREEQVAVAKSRFIYTIVGVVLAVLARGIVVAISGFFGFNGALAC